MEIQINYTELQMIHQRMLALKEKTTQSKKDIPILQGSGNMANAISEMAETFAGIEESIVGLIDCTVSFMDNVEAGFKAVEDTEVQNIDNIQTK